MTNNKIDFYVLDVKYLGSSFTLIVKDKDGNNDMYLKIPVIGAKFISTDEMMELFTDRIIVKDIGITENKLTYVDSRPVNNIDLDNIRVVLKYIKKGYSVITGINDKFDALEAKVKEIYTDYVDGLEETTDFFVNNNEEIKKNR